MSDTIREDIIQRSREAAVEAMREDPFIDDAHMLGTTEQDLRMEHYASVCLDTVLPLIAIASERNGMKRAAEIAQAYADEQDKTVRASVIARAILSESKGSN